MEPARTCIIINYAKENKRGILCAVLEDGVTMEFCLEPQAAPSLLGNIYIGKVKNLAPQIGAAFVEIAGGLVCHYSLQENTEHLIVNRTHSESRKPLVEGDEIIVQVNKEALKTKAPSVTSNLNFAGKYLVLTSGNKSLGISTKLPMEERDRLKSLLTPFCDGSFGLIARTNAHGVEEDLLKEELYRLKVNYDTVLEHGKTRTCFSLLFQEESCYLSVLKRLPKDTISDIVTDDPTLYEQLKAYLKEQQPVDLSKLRLYENRLLPLSKLHNLENELEDALRERIWLKSGGYLVIQPTEALTVIDVNTGKYEGGKKKQHTFRKINREAALETARQLRLRNLSGIILIDFIDMEDPNDRNELMEYLSQLLKKDPVKTVLVDMTKLNLVEITRKKEKKTLQEQYHALTVSGCK